MSKPSLLVCRAVAPGVIARFEQHFELRAADNLIGFFCGDGPTNPVNPEVLNAMVA